LYCVFFTVGTLLAFFGRFDLLDSFLDYFLKGFLEELSSFDEEKVFHLFENMSVLCVVCNEFAFVEQGIEFGVEKFTPGRTQGGGSHKIPLVKVDYSNRLTNPQKCLTHPEPRGLQSTDYTCGSWEVLVIGVEQYRPPRWLVFFPISLYLTK
jgi:hypothetical protein